MTISRENQLFQFSTNIKLAFAIQNRLNVNELEDIFESDENLRREYLEFFNLSFSTMDS